MQRKGRRYCIFMLFIQLSIGLSYAQQKPQYTQYILNNYIINPALTGIENYIDIKFTNRKQWIGLKDAPETSYLSIHFPLGKKDERLTPTSFDMTGESFYVYKYQYEYITSAPHHGLGFVATTDKAGALKQSNFNITYAYHLGLSAHVNLAVGLSAGVSHSNINFDDLKPGEAADQALSSGQVSRLKPDVNVGVWLYAPTYFAGASIQQVLPQNIVFNDDNTYKEATTVPHYFITAGYKFWFDDNYTLIPSVMLKWIKPLKPTLDYNVKFTFKDKLWLGGSYRESDAFSGMLGFNISSLVHISYAYDITTSPLNAVSKGTQEIMIGLTLNNKYKVLQPIRFW